MVRLKCNRCGKEFSRPGAKKAMKAKHHFCCNECRIEFSRKYGRLMQPTNKPKKYKFRCVLCGSIGESVKLSRRFCDDCSRGFLQNYNGYKKLHPEVTLIRYCEIVLNHNYSEKHIEKARKVLEYRKERENK